MRTCVLRDERQEAVCLVRDFAPDELAGTFSCTALIDASATVRLADARTILVSKDAYYSISILRHAVVADGAIWVTGILVVASDNFASEAQEGHAEEREDGYGSDGRLHSRFEVRMETGSDVGVEPTRLPAHRPCGSKQ
jgi:hypothetical protein